MENIYTDIARRTGGDIYIGVVGPVRTGKSTLIKRFMDSLVIPNIADISERERTVDELPQSASGRTVMTAEPKFIPDKAVKVTLDDNAEFMVKMIDCVGYMVPGAIGDSENGEPRMVMTPWSQSPVPFEKAAEIGTRKVITEHSTIGLMVTTDGTIGEIPREDYVLAEERVVNELKEMNKPFVIVLNSARPESVEATSLAYELEEKYAAPVALVNCLEISEIDITNIIRLVLFEFPVREIGVNLPLWIMAMEEDNALRRTITDGITEAARSINKIGDIRPVFEKLCSGEFIDRADTENINLGEGSALVDIKLHDGLFYDVISERTGIEINGDDDLMRTICELNHSKQQYDKIRAAVEEAQNSGYGIVTPSVEDMKLEQPEITKQQGGYGIKLKASAPSLHIIRANIQTEVNPIMGSEKQSEEMVKYLLHEFEEDPARIWHSNMFGKSLYDLVNEGLNTKLAHMPRESRLKIVETLGRIINEGSNGLICIIL
ncbi:MAG: stage IV sporulation protein A [Ruminococcaceae bacterium]|nr:stage IV sporulation protein A [Oscillospiraceae bacterium]